MNKKRVVLVIALATILIISLFYYFNNKISFSPIPSKYGEGLYNENSYSEQVNEEEVPDEESPPPNSNTGGNTGGGSGGNSPPNVNRPTPPANNIDNTPSGSETPQTQDTTGDLDGLDTEEGEVNSRGTLYFTFMIGVIIISMAILAFVIYRKNRERTEIDIKEEFKGSVFRDPKFDSGKMFINRNNFPKQ